MKHATFTLTRDLKHPPARVFRLWSDPALKRKWFVDHDGPEWRTLAYDIDFREGGREHGAWEMQSTDLTLAGTHANETTYLRIRPNELIVYAYSMLVGDVAHSASLATVEFAATAEGCRLSYTEQMAYEADGSDGPEMRKGGWNWLLDNLTTELELVDA